MPIEAGVYWNIEGKKPIVNRMDPIKLGRFFVRTEGETAKYTIPDVDSYIEHLEGMYNKDPFNMALHPEMERRIREHIKDNNGVLLDGAGPPGMHAEVLAVNQLFYRMDSAGIPIDQENLGKISVATFYVQGSSHRGNNFPACHNCGAILSEPITINTGRAGGSDE